MLFFFKWDGTLGRWSFCVVVFSVGRYIRTMEFLCCCIFSGTVH